MGASHQGWERRRQGSRPAAPAWGQPCGHRGFRSDLQKGTIAVNACGVSATELGGMSQRDMSTGHKLGRVGPGGDRGRRQRRPQGPAVSSCCF